jgi:hypothetical protein
MQRDVVGSRVAMWALALAFIAALASPVWSLEYPGPSPGAAEMEFDGRGLTARNAVIEVRWELGGEGLRCVQLADRASGRTFRPGAAEVFSVTFADGRTLVASDFRPTGKTTLRDLPADPKVVRQSLRFPGREARLPLAADDGRLRAVWRVIFRDGANYVRQELTLRAATGPLSIKKLTTLSIEMPDAQVQGNVTGSPVVSETFFVACEHPLAHNGVQDGTVVCGLPRYQPFRPGEAMTATTVIGVVPEGQLRRGFLHYVDRERARPYRPYAYYISWFDIAAPDRKMDEKLCLNRIHAFGRELVEKRGVKLDAFVFDDGWDDNRTLWKFHAGFPDGFAPLRAAAAKYGAGIGTWISPWGGYSRAKAERLEYGKTQGFETNRHGFSLAGPKYYKRFRDVCVGQMRDFDVGYFKFDGIGPGDVSAGAGTEYGPDIETLLELITDLRKVRADVFINTTVGTWPSPYWLWYSDSIWRTGRDVGFHGPGSTRQQWLTYRDMIGYQLRTRRGPLYPFNSLKFQSVMYAPLSLAANISNDPDDLVDDIRMAAASGTQMQEFFVTPDMMTAPLWDAAAEAIQWSRENADVLVDTHGIGGDPGKGEVYGYASWSPRKGILVLRNPSEKPARHQVDPADVFELPEGACRKFRLTSPWKDEAEARPALTLNAGEAHTFELAPFEVVVLDAEPAG